MNIEKIGAIIFVVPLLLWLGSSIVIFGIMLLFVEDWAVKLMGVIWTLCFTGMGLMFGGWVLRLYQTQ